MNVLILGDGLLGKEIQQQTGWSILSRKKDGFDLEKFYNFKDIMSQYDTIVNCIANTDTYSNDKDKHWNVNYVATVNFIDWCSYCDIRLIHISTDYIYANSIPNASENDVPVHCGTWYGYTKLLSDAYVQLKMSDYVVVRCSFKPRPFPYDEATTLLKGNFDYVDVIADKIIKLTKSNLVGVYNVGTREKNMYELAIESKPNVKRSDLMINKKMPLEVTMDMSKFMDTNLG